MIACADPTEKQRLIDDLKAYCQLDTLTMVEIQRFLVSLLKAWFFQDGLQAVRSRLILCDLAQGLSHRLLETISAKDFISPLAQFNLTQPDLKIPKFSALG